jgi:serine/threonine-protein kinase RIO1
MCKGVKAAINDTHNETFEYLKEGIENVIKYFSKELFDLINNRFETSLGINNVHYGLLNDVSKVILHQIMFKNKLEEVREVLLKM